MIEYLALNYIMFAQIFKVLFFMSLIMIEVLFFGVNSAYAARAVIGALIGGLVLTYFDNTKPNHQKMTWIDATIKTLLSALSSLFIAPVFIKYYSILDLDYVGFIYFIFSLIALIMLKALHSLTEKNAKDIILSILARFLNLETKKERFERQIKGKEN